MNEHTGQCSCGKVEYSFSGDPINVAYCYCTSCQIHTNSDKWHGLWVAKQNFSFNQTEPSTFTRKGDSGMDMVHHFCSTCGVTLAVFVEIGNFFSVGANTLNATERPKPNMLIYTKNASSLALFPKDVPKYDILPPEMM